ncbi:MAG: right-handed parallel beta-helix repeat-containing protein, partial [Tannerella sp.]|nr:right-handed parallel beta-helix repeat-containing protein [Tannerella sp.]
MSPTATGSGNGTSSASPWTLEQLATALASAGSLYSTAHLEVYFFGGTYNIPAGSGLVGTPVLVLPAALLDAKFTSVDPRDRPVFNAPTSGTASAATRRARFFTVTTRTTPLVEVERKIEVNNLEFRNFYANASLGEGSLFNLGASNANLYTTLELDSLVIDNCSNTGAASYLIGITGNASSRKSLTLTNSIIRNTPNRGRLIENNGASANNNLIVHDNIIEGCVTERYLFNLINGTNAIHNNIIRDCPMTTTFDRYILNASAARVAFYDNTIYNNTLHRVINTTGGTTTIHNNTINGNTSIQVLYASGGTVTLYDNRIYTNALTYVMYFLSGAKATVHGNSVYDNTVVTSFLRTADATTNLSFYKNSVYDNNVGDYLMNLVAPSDIYNNTFSNNNLTGTANNRSIYINNAAASSLKLVNNTIYRSGGLNFGSNRAGTRIANNIIVNSGMANAILTGGNTAVTFRTNVLNVGLDIFFRPTKADDGSNSITSSFNSYFGALDTSDPAPGRQVHRLMNLGNTAPPWDIHSGTNVSALIPFTDDQLGTARPQPFAIGSYDVDYMKLQPGKPVYLTFIPGIRNAAVTTIDLHTLFNHRMAGGKPEFTFLSAEPSFSPVGTLSSPPIDGLVTFTPGFPNVEGRVRYKYNVTQGPYSATDSFDVIVLDATLFRDKAGDLPGYIDTESSDLGACYDYMGSVEFTKSFRFIGSYTGATKPANWSGDKINPDTHRLYGFSITLVGDLDHDGYPEIVGLGRQDGNNGSYDLNARYLYIYDGRSGKELSRFNLDMETGSTNFTIGGWHSAPSNMALIDSDRDGNIEVIMAFPSAPSSSAFANKVVSYELKKLPAPATAVVTNDPNNKNEVHNVGSHYSISLKWFASASNHPQYNIGATSYNKPIPQVVDFDFDGNAEVLVYNKIYDARTGILKVTLGTLGSSGTYVGGDVSGIASEDETIPFSYIYDLDLDGKYDVAAGGKVYYDFDFSQANNSDRYKVLDGPSEIQDGRTGVADINGDGIPDIVVINRATSTARLNMFVWNPDFLRLDGNGNAVPNTGTKAPKILASRDLFFAQPDEGSNSYVYIGDIDGREQTTADGKTYRLPEIAVLAGRYTFGNDLLGVHPNVVGLGIPSTGNSTAAGSEGVIAAFTWDATPGLEAPNRLKMSFVLGHEDTSGNTGFTMFDFDNDGMQEICYRDEQNLRIIKASKPYITASETEETSPGVILFRQMGIQSYTGFEYPVIADIDGDASAEIVVIGGNNSGSNAYGYIYAVGNGSGDKFAPALPVWNQFMYDPFKITADSLTTPRGKAPNRLDPIYNRMIREIKDANNNITKVIEKANPFNGTLIQSSYINGNTLPIYEPIVFLTGVYISPSDDPDMNKRPRITEASGKSYIEITIGNRSEVKTSVSANLPVAIYTGNVISHATRDTVMRLEDLFLANTTTPLGESFTIAPNTSFRVWIPVKDPDEMYIVRLGDSSDEFGWHFGYNGGVSGMSYGCEEFNQGTGLAARAFRDCNWCDQTVRAAKFNVFSDRYTVQEFKSVEMNILANDILPDMPAANDNYYLTNLVLADTHIETPPKAGYLAFNGKSGVANRVTYHHVDSVPLTAAIDSFRYKLTFWNPQENAYITKRTWVYIYVLESATYGFSACYGERARIEIRDLPQEVGFDWYKTHESAELIETGRIHNTAAMKGDSTYWLKPVMTGVTDERYQLFDFPRGELTVSLATRTQGATATMQWTGLFGANWRDSRNWVEVKTENGYTYTTPVHWPPNACVDVIIPSNTEYYPELIDSVACRNITFKDRAMLKNPHVLKYDSAQVEIKLKPSERDRFVMWSAPLLNMYSGDYHFKDAISSRPRWGDVYINYFQQTRPGGGTAAPLVFTSSFGQLAEPLGLGKTFNLKVTSTTATKDQRLVFPQKSASYTADNGVSYPTVRTADAGKFITEGQNPYLRSDTTFALPVANPNAGSSLIQVVNPYLAYLSFAQFRAGNSGDIHNGYYLWNGDVNASFTVINTNGNRYSITEPSLGASPDLIPPLQSFLVKKLTPGAEVATLWMSPNWTTTSAPASSYMLRAAPVVSDANTLRIKASQGNKTSYAILVYDPNASPDLGQEDMPVLIYDEIPLTLYSYTALREPLAIHASSDFR